MGGSASEIRYAVPISDKPEHETAVYRSPEYKDKLLDRPEPHLGTMKDIFINSSNKYRDRRALGKIVTK